MNSDRISMKLSIVVQTAVIAVFPFAILSGCNTAPENHAPPSIEARAKTITDNPHMSQEQKDAALAKMQMNQNYTNAVGNARVKAMAASKKPGQ